MKQNQNMLGLRAGKGSEGELEPGRLGKCALEEPRRALF